MSATVLVLCSCAQLPKNYEREITTHVTGTEDTGLGLRSISVRMQNPGVSRIIPLVDGVDAFYARLALIIRAERSLDIQYFLWHKDVTGQVLLKHVLDAADRGVRVRLLLDDLANHALDPEFYALDTHPNVSIRLFNAFPTRGFKYIDFFTHTARINRRMHNKTFTADNQYTILGGRNIGDEYFDAQEDTNFYDYDVLATGPVVEKVSKAFDAYWNHDTVTPIYAFKQNTATARDLEELRIHFADFVGAQHDTPYADDVRASSLAQALRGGEFVTYTAYFGDVDVIYDDPDKGLVRPPSDYQSMIDLVSPHMQGARREIVLISPYFVPGPRGVESAVGRVKDGVEIIVITNSYASTDAPIVHAGYSRYREPLLTGDVEIHELKPSARLRRQKGTVAYESAASLHTKVFIIDRKIVFIGSLNLDPRSIDINTEIGVLFHSPELAQDLISNLDGYGLEHVYELEFVRSPSESKGEFTTYTWSIEWIERTGDETIRHKNEPGIGVLDRFLLFLLGFAPESQI